MVIKVKKKEIAVDPLEIESLMRETEGAGLQRTDISAPPLNPIWRVLGVIVLGILVLFATDSVEIERVSTDGQPGIDLDGAPGHTTIKTLDDYTGPDPQSVNSERPGIEETSPIAPPIAPPTAPPIAPPTAPPIAPPTAPPIDSDPDTPTDDAPVGAPTTPPIAPPTAPPIDSVPDTPTDDAPVGASSPTIPAKPATTIEGESTLRHTYKRRGQPLSDENRKALIDQYGSWTLVDTKTRPTQDFYKKYPNRDIPRSEFPSNAWQMDEEYLGKFLSEAIALTQRAQEGILNEYGYTQGTFENRADPMFGIELIDDLANATGLSKPKNGEGRDSISKGGWTTKKSWEGLKRRLLHAIMTEDSFVFAMGGHSAAAGHGNHFVQSYTLQVQWILEAVFARLGVKHEARNFGNGGLGTTQNGIAAASSYGPDVDMLMWDSGMTEKEEEAKDMMARQQLLAGKKVPILWSFGVDTLTFLNTNADVDVGYMGSAQKGITEATSMEEFRSLPWAMRTVKCSAEIHQECRKEEYRGVCWIERDDFTPENNQLGVPGGRAGWHPGDRIHQVKGRVLAWTILSALKEALTMWKEADGFALKDEDWHVTARYEEIRKNLNALPQDSGFCPKYDAKNIGFVCKYPVKARSEFSPRAYPGHSNIRNLMPPEQRALVGSSEDSVYQPPDVFNPNLHPPPGEVDVLNIVEAGVDFTSTLNPSYAQLYKMPKFSKPPTVPIGKGISLDQFAGDAGCDGSVDSWCNRGKTNNCLLSGHNDGRNGLKFDGYSGWVVMNLPDLRYGYVAVKFESWHQSETVPATTGWTSVNNEGGTRKLREVFSYNNTKTTRTQQWAFDDHGRKLGKKPPPEFCDEFKFEYAIDGKITSLKRDEFLERKVDVQRVVESITILEDPEYTGGKEKEVEIAIRIVGCGRKKVFRMSHIYWA